MDVVGAVFYAHDDDDVDGPGGVLVSVADQKGAAACRKHEKQKAASAASAAPLPSDTPIPGLHVPGVHAHPVEAALQRGLDIAAGSPAAPAGPAGLSPSSPSSPSTPCPEPAVAFRPFRPHQLENWVANSVESFEAIVFFIDAQTKPLGDKWQLALIMFDDASAGGAKAVAFVNVARKSADGAPFPKPTLVRAQTVRVEDNLTIVWPTPAFRPWRDYSDAQVILPTCKVAPVKAKQVHLRADMNKQSYRLRRMYSIAAGGGFATTAGNRCYICAKADGSTQFCSFCLSSMHATCLVSARPFAERKRSSLPRHNLPDLFKEPGVVCNLCTLFL